MRTAPYMQRMEAIEAFKKTHPNAVDVSAMWRPGPSPSLMGEQPGVWEFAWCEHHEAALHEADLR